jgi:radical SAM protein with 4Fe4S-binding SPASM domain
VFWRITARCDLDCIHCGSHLPAAGAEQLDTSQMLELADQLVALGCKQVVLTGGEPLLRQDFRQLAARLLEGELDVSLVTNGTGVEADLASWCAREGLGPVYVSLDGREATHDQLRRRAGSFREVGAAATALREAGVAVGAITTLVRSNLSDLEEIQATLNELGVLGWQVRIARHAGELGAEDHLLPEEIPGLVERLRALARRGRGPKIVANNTIGYYGACEVELRHGAAAGWQGCTCGVTSMVVEPDGRVQACSNIPIVEGDLRVETLATLWNREDAFACTRRASEADLDGACRTCSWAGRCRGGCWAFAVRGPDGRRENRHCLQHPATGGPRFKNTLWNRLWGSGRGR